MNRENKYHKTYLEKKELIFRCTSEMTKKHIWAGTIEIKLF